MGASSERFVDHFGLILTPQQVLEATGWSTDDLAQAAEQGRVLRVYATDRTFGYWSRGLTGTRPRIPIRGIEDALRAWAFADVDPWTIASWMSTEQIELKGRTPRAALLDGDVALVVTLARQTAARLS